MHLKIRGSYEARRKLAAMAEPMRVTMGRLCRDTRLLLDISQLELARAVGVSRAYIVAVEAGRASPNLDIAERIGVALGLELRLLSVIPNASQERQVEPVHAWCSGYSDRRIRTAGLDVLREVPVGSSSRRGWIDLLAFDPRTRVLVIVEVKTVLDDLGAIERQLGWYERSWRATVEEIGWQPVRAVSWLLVLATDDADGFIRRNRQAMREAFPGRASGMRALLRADVESPDIASMPGRRIALIDPSSRRRDWLIPTTLDGRRSGAPFLDYADAARRHAA